MFVGQFEEAVEEGVEPGLVAIGQGQGQRAPGRRRGHGGQVAQVHRQRLVADVGRRGVVREMHAGDQGVAGHHQFVARRQGQHRGVVADAPDHVVAAGGALADAVDQGEFARASGRRRGACASAARQSAAAWSSTPLTKVWPCSEPKRLVVSIASLITTR